VVHHLRAAEDGTAEPIVRVPWNEPVMVKRVLDQGANTLLFPFVQSAMKPAARLRRRATHRRGSGASPARSGQSLGRVKDYIRPGRGRDLRSVQAETRARSQRIEDIAAVRGVDGIFIGPADLSADFGRHNKWRNRRSGTPSSTPGGASRPPEIGRTSFLESKRSAATCWPPLRFVAVGSDTGLPRTQTEALVKYL